MTSGVPRGPASSPLRCCQGAACVVTTHSTGPLSAGRSCAHARGTRPGAAPSAATAPFISVRRLIPSLAMGRPPLLLRRGEGALDAGDRDRALHAAVLAQRASEDQVVRRAVVIGIELERDRALLDAACDRYVLAVLERRRTGQGRALLFQRTAELHRVAD